MAEELLTLAEVMGRLRKSRPFVSKELRNGNLRGSLIGGQWRIRSSDLDAYLDASANDRVPA